MLTDLFSFAATQPMIQQDGGGWSAGAIAGCVAAGAFLAGVLAAGVAKIVEYFRGPGQGGQDFNSRRRRHDQAGRGRRFRLQRSLTPDFEELQEEDSPDDGSSIFELSGSQGGV